MVKFAAKAAKAASTHKSVDKDKGKPKKGKNLKVDEMSEKAMDDKLDYIRTRRRKILEDLKELEKAEEKLAG